MLHIDPPRVMGESEAEHQARIGRAAARAQASKPGVLTVVGDCWKQA